MDTLIGLLPIILFLVPAALIIGIIVVVSSKNSKPKNDLERRIQQLKEVNRNLKSRNRKHMFY
ncbi:hypothetical protein [Paenisporosarcina antarctica]|uniref:Uncharacterized protein n=1 Tax=Paenisporosarcina antarctica TaxID=417367 RepID=A0A4P6ZUQ6_9BACL|nr:hypothetical protein [Paenisporosarcina antarctica]QBP39699.1 hypothetical protein E2636_00340 [Paenisporosarcina antarctica]